MSDRSPRRLLTVGALALLLVTAGCSDLPIVADVDEESTAGYGVAGADLDGATIDNETAAAIERAGSYTIEDEVSFEISENGTTTTSAADGIRHVDLETDRGVRNRTISQTSDGTTVTQDSAVYTNGDNSSQRVVFDGGQPQYATTADPRARITPVNVTGFADSFAPTTDALQWERTGTEQFDGVAVTRYEATGVANETKLVGEDGSVQNATGTLLVDADGLLRELTVTATYDLAGQTVSGESRVTISDVGSATVSEPDWLTEATADA